MHHQIKTESDTVELSDGNITVYLLIVNDVHVATFDHDFLADEAALSLAAALNKPS